MTTANEDQRHENFVEEQSTLVTSENTPKKQTRHIRVDRITEAQAQEQITGGLSRCLPPLEVSYRYFSLLHVNPRSIYSALRDPLTPGICKVMRTTRTRSPGSPTVDGGNVRHMIVRFQSHASTWVRIFANDHNQNHRKGLATSNVSIQARISYSGSWLESRGRVLDHETDFVPNLSWWKSALLFTYLPTCPVCPPCTVSAEWLLWTWLVLTQNVRQQVFQLTQAKKSREKRGNVIGMTALKIEESSIVLQRKITLERFMRHGWRRSHLAFACLARLKC